MEKKEIVFSVNRYHGVNEIPEKIQQLIHQATESALLAHAPYSHFQVGAVVELENGILVAGNNQENIAYPSGLCAERVALFAARANYPEQIIKRLVLVAIDHNKATDQPAYPCGACRQVMVDIERVQQKPMEIWMAGTQSIEMVEQAVMLLPMEFKWGGPQSPA
ncbi:MAG: cytidine deaminase [Bacteroidales bacterium]|nr:cytidine deaminase [Bacteroidales bacterium]